MLGLTSCDSSICPVFFSRPPWLYTAARYPLSNTGQHQLRQQDNDLRVGCSNSCGKRHCSRAAGEAPAFATHRVSDFRHHEGGGVGVPHGARALACFKRIPLRCGPNLRRRCQLGMCVPINFASVFGRTISCNYPSKLLDKHELHTT